MKNTFIHEKVAFHCSFLREIILSSFFLLVAFAADSQPTVSSASPSSQTVCSTSSPSFAVTASGIPTLTYQWQVSTNGTVWNPVSNGASYSGVNTATLTIISVPPSFTGNSYRCAVTNSQGTGISASGALTVNASPVAQATSYSIVQCSSEGSGGALAVDPSSNYQWQLSSNNGSSWSNLSDGTVYSGSATYDLTWNLGLSMNGNLYRFIITDPVSGCSTTSIGVDTLYVVGSPSFLGLTPTNANICPGSNTSFAIMDSTGVSYQWQISTNNGASWNPTTDGTTYTGSSTFSLSINAPATAARYRVNRMVTAHGTTCNTFSNFAPLSIKTNGSVTTPPADVTQCEGLTATFKVVAGGSTPFTYQWQTDNGSSPSVWSAVGTSSPTLNNTSITNTMNGYHYRVLVQGACGGQLTTTPVTLHVNSSGTWLGTSNTAWENSLNWCGGVPVQATNVLVPAAAPNMPTISTTTGTAYSTALAIQNGAILTISGGSTSMFGPFSILGTVAYTANADQQILPADHGSLTIGGSGNKFLQGNVAISSNLGLGGSAKLVTGSYTLSMKAGSNPISGASYGTGSNSWIVTGNGGIGAANSGLGGLRIAQIGSTSGNVFFPVGPTPASYTPLQLNNGGAVNDFSIAVNDQNIPGGPVGAVIDRTWLVSAANAGSSNITLGLQWNLSDEPITLFDRSNAEIIRSNGVSIVEKSTIGAAAGSSPYSLNKGSFSTLTQFTVGTSSLITLQLQLQSFSGIWMNHTSVGLSWKTEPGYEARSFVVQRSEDGIHFSTIATVDGAHGVSSYSYTDNHPADKNSYRLQLVAEGGDLTYSQTILLGAPAVTEQAALAPSVTEGGPVNLFLSLNQGADIRYMLSDITGHVLSVTSVRLGNGVHTLPLDISHLPGGVYFVRISGSDGFSKVLTLVKK